jgi:hypothetical protein
LGLSRFGSPVASVVGKFYTKLTAGFVSGADGCELMMRKTQQYYATVARQAYSVREGLAKTPAHRTEFGDENRRL